MACGGDAEPRALDVTVVKEKYQDGILNILSVIRPEWQKGTIKFKLLKQGMLNLLVTCYVGKDVDKDAIVVRIYGETLDTLFKRDHELSLQNCFAHLGLAPNVYCTFKNGVCCEFVPGTTYEWDEKEVFHQPEMAKLVAKEMAKYHCNKSLEYAKKCEIGPALVGYGTTKQVLQYWPMPLKDKELNDLFYNDKDMYNKEELGAEIDIFINLEKENPMPDVLNHGDMNPTNIIYQEKEGKIVAVDYELGGMSSPIQDINSFLLLSALGIYEGDVEKKQHSPDFCKMFIRTYLEELRKLNGEKGPLKEILVEKYYILFLRSFLSTLIQTSVFIPTFVNQSDRVDPKELIRMNQQRLDYYKKNKEHILSMKVPYV